VLSLLDQAGVRDATQEAAAEATGRAHAALQALSVPGNGASAALLGELLDMLLSRQS
jgi:hypothetical protein